tara:strand:- start:1587 stop:1958 length:372 start_codon:yes stop_codon:yes gene_type:complete
MGKSRKGYIMGSKLQQMAEEHGPFKQVDADKVLSYVKEPAKEVIKTTVKNKMLKKLPKILRWGGRLSGGIGAISLIGKTKKYMADNYPDPDWKTQSEGSGWKENQDITTENLKIKKLINPHNL